MSASTRSAGVPRWSGPAGLVTAGGAVLAGADRGAAAGALAGAPGCAPAGIFTTLARPTEQGADMLFTGAHEAALRTSVTGQRPVLLAGLGPAAVVRPWPGSFRAAPGPPARYRPATIRTGTASRAHRYRARMSPPRIAA